MAEALYEKHRKYHDLVTRIQETDDDELHNQVRSVLTGVVEEYFSKHAQDGVFDLNKLSADEVKKMSDAIFDKAGYIVGKKYLGLSEQTINDLKDKKTPDGLNAFDSLVASWIRINRNQMYDRLKTVGRITADNKHFPVQQVVRNIQEKRVNDIVQAADLKYDDIGGVDSYMRMVKKHNPKATKNLRYKDAPKSTEEAGSYLASAAQTLPDNYHPDKKDTYN